MKNHQNCGFWTKVLIYALVLTINMLYMPVAGLSIASAKGKPSVYVLGFAGDDSTPGEIIGETEDVFKSELRKESKINYISDRNADRLLKSTEKVTPTTDGVKGDSKKFAKAEKYLARAKKYFSDERMDRVAKYAGRAVKYYRANADYIKNFDDVRDAYLYLAAGLAESDKDATKALLNVLAFDPGFKLPSKMDEYLDEMFEEAQDERMRAKLTITANPEDAEIIVNGNKKSSPASFDKLPAGDYFVRVSHKNMKPYTKVITLSEKQKEEMTIVLDGERKSSGGEKKAVLAKLEKKLAKQDFDRAFFGDLQKVGSWLNADYIVLGGFKSTDSRSRLYPLLFAVSSGEMAEVKSRSVSHKDSGKASGSIKREYKRTERSILGEFPPTILTPGFVLGSKAKAAPAVAAAPAPTPKKVAPKPAPAPKSLNLDVDASILLSSDDATKAMEDNESEESIAPIERTPIYKKWWFWTIIGAVVVGGGVTTGILLAPDDSAKTSKLVIPEN